MNENIKNERYKEMAEKEDGIIEYLEELKKSLTTSREESPEINAAHEEMVKDFMKYASEDINEVLFEFQECITYKDFIDTAMRVRNIAGIAALLYCKHKRDELASEERWEEVDKSETIYAKKKKESGIVDSKIH